MELERELTLSAEDAAVAAGTDWLSPCELEAAARPQADEPTLVRPSWSVMVAQLAGSRPEPIRVSDFGRGSRVICRALSGDHEEQDFDEDEEPPRRARH